jgi:hypothetical protein
MNRSTMVFQRHRLASLVRPFVEANGEDLGGRGTIST